MRKMNRLYISIGTDVDMLEKVLEKLSTKNKDIVCLFGESIFCGQNFQKKK